VPTVRLPKAARFSKVTTHPSADERLAAAGRGAKVAMTEAGRQAEKKGKP
jgi:hypothetical protein